MVQSQTRLIERMGTREVRLQSIDTQTHSPGPLTYAEAARRTPSASSHSTTAAGQAENKKSRPQSAKEKKQARGVPNPKSDVKTTNNVTNPVTSNFKEKVKEEDLPSIAFLHDSVLRGVQHRRLGHSYGFSVLPRKASQTGDILKQLETISCEDKPLDGIVLHCGVNDLKNEDAQTVSKRFAESVRKIQKVHRNTCIVVSKIAAVTNEKLEMKRQLFNALVSKELFGVKDVTVVSHNLNTSHLKDGVHPTMKGSSILAANLGRHVRQLFWTRPKRTRAVQQPPRGTQFHRHGPPRFSGARDPWWNMYDVLQGWC